MPGEKARWVLHKDAVCCFEQILKPAPYKTAAVWPLNFHLINHPRRTRPVGTSVNWPAKVYIYKLCKDTGAADNWRESRETMLLACFDDGDDIEACTPAHKLTDWYRLIYAHTHTHIYNTQRDTVQEMNPI